MPDNATPARPTTDALIAKAKAAQLPNYRPPPYVMSEGRGCRLRDVEGREWLDFSGGIAVLSAGHCHPTLQAAIAAQAGRLMHTSNLFYNDRAIELATEIVARTPFDKVYFANSGAEANEALLKLARRWHHEHGRGERTELVSALKSFHGRTMGALTLTGQPKYHVGMGPMVGGVSYVPFDDLAAMDAAITERTAAVFLEPVQGEGGLVVPSEGYLAGVRKLCDERGALLFFDEVQTGWGRTGRFLAQEHSGVVPDGCSLAKGIGGGFPLGAIAVREHVADGLPPGSHASTYGGNALACAAGLAVLSIFDAEGLVENARVMGERLGAGLEAMAADASIGAATEARGQGLLRGVALAEGVVGSEVMGALREDAGLLVTIAGGTVLRLAPALTVTAEEVDEALGLCRQVLSAMS